MKYKIISYKLQDGRWGSSFSRQQPIDSNSDHATVSETIQLGAYFQTQAEADEYTHSYLVKSGVATNDILRKSDKKTSDLENNNGNYPL